jgi:hypothetical protein
VYTDRDVEDVTEKQLLAIMKDDLPPWAVNECLLRGNERAAYLLDIAQNGPIFDVLSDNSDDDE